jgi:hypothetical protein
MNFTPWIFSHFASIIYEKELYIRFVIFCKNSTAVWLKNLSQRTFLDLELLSKGILWTLDIKIRMWVLRRFNMVLGSQLWTCCLVHAFASCNISSRTFVRYHPLYAQVPIIVPPLLPTGKLHSWSLYTAWKQLWCTEKYSWNSCFLQEQERSLHCTTS